MGATFPELDARADDQLFHARRPDAWVETAQVATANVDTHRVYTLIRERVLSVLPLLAASAVVPAALIHFLGPEEVHFSAEAHFLPIAVSAGLAAAAALALTVAGARRGDSRAVLVGTAFSSMAALLAIHGLATPGLLVGENGVISFTGAATLPVGGAVLALSVLPSIKRGERVRALLVLQAVLIVLIVGLGTVGILAPSIVPSVPESGSTAAWILLGIGMCFYAILAIRAARTFLLTRRRADLLVVFGTVLLCVALPAALLLTYADLGWWMGHGFELIGITLVCVPVAADLHRGAQSRPLAGDLRGAEFVRAADVFLGPTVRALLVRLAEKDTYTAAHTRAVALRAAQVGEELGLAPSRLRDLAIGAMVHDVGKLSVPDSILQKPGSLDDDEFEVIKEHPRRGLELLEELGGFSPLVLGLVLDHHERLDGSGYPRGLGAEDLNLETRVLAACDVFDALISKRVYREAWTVDDALDLLRRESGTTFDPRCVAAIERIEMPESGRPAPLPQEPAPRAGWRGGARRALTWR
jgi:HD-GYP domain-containing protein (c-di-GMP phosphodiesterase class II)